jgi:hypothetical protein
MKKRPSKKSEENGTMRPEYDFRGGVRGKHYKAYRQGHTVKICKADGTTSVRHFTRGEGMVVLAPDVRKFFSDSDAVNNALRSLIRLFPQNRPVRKKRVG